MYKAYKDENIHSHYDVYISRTLAKGGGSGPRSLKHGISFGRVHKFSFRSIPSRKNRWRIFSEHQFHFLNHHSAERSIIGLRLARRHGHKTDGVLGECQPRKWDRARARKEVRAEKKEKTTQTRKALKQRKGEGTSKPATPSFDVAGPLLWCCCKDGNVLSVVQPHQCLHLPPATQNGKAIRNLRCASRTAPVGHEMQLTKLLYFAQSPQSFASVGAALLAWNVLR